MFYVIGKPKRVEQLKTLPRNNHNKRETVPICIIDDEPFPYTDLLRKHDFNIKEIGNISDIKSVEYYPIVLCDIRGVGAAFGSRFEGGHVIEEIKRYYPYKIVFAYSAHQMDASFQRFFQLCDFSIKKDIDTDEWVELLHNAVELVLDPVKQWGRLRKALLAVDVNSIDLVYIEDQYTNKFLNPSKEFPEAALADRLQEDVKQLVLRFASSSIFKMIFG
ncbi:MAG: hypothetical protein HQ510_06295 [Candidatus Marinimicrobia bacterium]|nr:hypothetical protein [Candidatus Neomarinimicrobiota bacterium]